MDTLWLNIYFKMATFRNLSTLLQCHSFSALFHSHLCRLYSYPTSISDTHLYTAVSKKNKHCRPHISPWNTQTLLAFLGQRLPTEAQHSLLFMKYCMSYFSLHVCMLPNNPSHKYLLPSLNKLYYGSRSSSSASAGQYDNPPRKRSHWQMCAWLSRITAVIRKIELYPLVEMIQWWSSTVLLYGKYPVHTMPTLIQWP